jgi:hypothetical protein
MGSINFTMSYEGASADRHRIDLYDVSTALIGFQRSLALTAHLLLNDEIITQAPSLKNAKIFAIPPEAGSWKLTAVISTALYTLGTAQNNSPVGHVLYSLYDYVISESLGVHVDYNKSLGVLYKEAAARKIAVPVVKENQVDALIEKCSNAIIEMHRPIVKSGSASQCIITCGQRNHEAPLRTPLNRETYAYIHETIEDRVPNVYEGRVSSYNTNTFKGRIYIPALGRPVAFELEPNTRSNREVEMIARSLFHSGLKQYQEPGSLIYIVASQKTSKGGVLKSLMISKVSDKPYS